MKRFSPRIGRRMGCTGEFEGLDIWMSLRSFWLLELLLFTP